MQYDIIVEKNIDLIEEIAKFNPYHDARGRFTTAGGGGKFYATPGKSKAHDKAIAREKVKDNPYRHMKTDALEREEGRLITELNRAADAANMDANSSSAAVRRKQREGEAKYKEIQGKLRLVYQMQDYNSVHGNANDSAPF